MAFLDFLDYVIDDEDVTDFFIVGYILDVWRRDAVGVAIENNDALDMLKGGVIENESSSYGGEP